MSTVGDSLVKINTSNGNFDSNFGKDGFVGGVKTLTPPIIYNNSIYVLTFNAIKIYDLISGTPKGIINIHPKNKKFNQGGYLGVEMRLIQRIIFVFCYCNQDQH